MFSIQPKIIKGDSSAHSTFIFDEVEGSNEKIVFSSNFDNGSLARIERSSSNHYGNFKLWTAPDNLGEEFQSKHCAWFYFTVTGLKKGTNFKATIQNASNHGGLYKYDMRPVYCSEKGRNHWMRLKLPVKFVKVEDDDDEDCDTKHLTFEHLVEYDDDKISFAFTYPYSYSTLQKELDTYDEKYWDSSIESASLRSMIYYRREVLIYSPDGRKIDLLTITSSENLPPNLIHSKGIDGSSSVLSSEISKTSNENISNNESLEESSAEKISSSTSNNSSSTQQYEQEPLLPGLFPESANNPRPLSFPNLPVLLFMARVHPGEVPGQHALRGLLELLLDKEEGKSIRENYVVMIIPMLNPDGVYRGHFRMDQYGNNLNRYYLSPSRYQHPSIYGAKLLIDNLCEREKLFLMLDFHAHANKRGCFIYGNVVDNLQDQIQNLLYCKILSYYTPFFDYNGSVFNKNHMKRIDPGDASKGLSAEGCSRVSTYINHKLIHSYTLECNYNMSKIENEVVASSFDLSRNNADFFSKYKTELISTPKSHPHFAPLGSQPPITNPSSFNLNGEKYSPSSFYSVGRACLSAILEMRGQGNSNRYRVLKSKSKTIDKLRNSILLELRDNKDFSNQSPSTRGSSNSSTASTSSSNSVSSSGNSSMNIRERRRQTGSSSNQFMDYAFRRVVGIDWKSNNSGNYVHVRSRSNSSCNSSDNQSISEKNDNGEPEDSSSTSNSSITDKKASTFFISVPKETKQRRRRSIANISSKSTSLPPFQVNSTSQVDSDPNLPATNLLTPTVPIIPPSSKSRVRAKNSHPPLLTSSSVRLSPSTTNSPSDLDISSAIEAVTLGANLPTNSNSSDLKGKKIIPKMNLPPSQIPSMSLSGRRTLHAGISLINNNST